VQSALRPSLPAMRWLGPEKRQSEGSVKSWAPRGNHRGVDVWGCTLELLPTWWREDNDQGLPGSCYEWLEGKVAILVVEHSVRWRKLRLQQRGEGASACRGECGSNQWSRRILWICPHFVQLTYLYFTW